MDDPTPRTKQRPLLVIALLLTVAFAFGAGFFVRDYAARRATPSPTATPVEPAVDVASKVLPSTVFVRAGNRLGSGFIYDASGLIFTSAHVVGNAKAARIRLPDGTPLRGRVLGRDAERDVAVVKVKHDRPLPAARLASQASVRVGQLAVAVGSPFGFDESVSVGVISGLGRTLETEGGAVDAIQTDATINVGNSGGPLADREGRVIGISAATYRSADGGVGLAVPIDVAVRAASYLEEGKKPPRVGFIGLRAGEPGADERGVMVIGVQPDRPAARGGIENGDIIVSVDGEQVTAVAELAAIVRNHAPGDKIRITLRRDGVELEVRVTVGRFN